MNKTNRIALCGALAIALSMAPGAFAQNTEDKGRATDSDLGGRTLSTWPGDVNADRASLDQASSIPDVNKASKLIGMNVRNLQNERLGEIEDLVVDFKSGKISYAVLAVGGFLGIGEKYVAIPPSAFSMGADRDSVVLNADKAKFENAPSFAKNDWPALDDNAPYASYWAPDATAVGTPAQSTIGTGSSGWEAAPNQNQNLNPTPADTDVNQPRADHNLRSSDASRLDADRSEAKDAKDMFRGRITAIDPQQRTMTVEGPSGSRQFTFDDKPTLTLKDSRNPRLTDLKVGFPVEVGYRQEGGNYIAENVLRTDTPEVR
ncbi:MAG: PRC-barrel domain-containing protein [Verrucomicrobiia bacterium]